MIEPYYQDSHCVIFHGDSLEILDLLEKHDLLLTDPPYGIGESMGKNNSRRKVAKPTNYGYSEWDKTTRQDIIDKSISLCEFAIVFGGNFYSLPPSSCWLVWDKEITGDFADCELAWTNLFKAVRKIRHTWNGMIRLGGEERFHPTQKPLAVMKWCILQSQHKKFKPVTILDPFMGSGTTLRAAKDLGRKAVGIEIEEQYCEIAAKRLAQEVLF
jgi:DNA modification methylase